MIRLTNPNSALTEGVFTYLLIGDDAFVAEHLARRIRSAWCTDAQHLRVEGTKEATLHEAYAWLTQPSLLPEKRCLQGRITQLRVSKDALEPLMQCLNSSGPDRLVLLRLPKLTDAQCRQAPWSQLLTAGEVVPCHPPKRHELVQWMQGMLDGGDDLPQPALLQAVAQRCCDHSDAVWQWTQRYQLLEGLPQKERMREALVAVTPDHFFDVVEQALGGKPKGLLSLIQSLPTQDLLGLVSYIQSLFQQLAQNHGLVSMDPPPKIWPSRQRQLKQWGMHWTSSRVSEALSSCAKMERCFKQGQSDRTRWMLADLWLPAP